MTSLGIVVPHRIHFIMLWKRVSIKGILLLLNNPRSHAVSTKRTILSPFTKEYRVLAANSGIRLFLEGFLLADEPLKESQNFNQSLEIGRTQI